MKTEGYSMPSVQVGDMVYWFGDGDPSTRPAPAVVTQLGNTRVSLSVMLPGNFNHQPVSGVPHVTDPTNATRRERDAGSWQHRREWQQAQKARESAAAKQRQEKEAAASA